MSLRRSARRPPAILPVAPLLLAVALLAAPAPSAAAAGDVLTEYDVAALRTVTEAAISPDGGTIAYLLSVPRRPFEDDDGPAWVELHLAGDDGPLRPFVTGEVKVEKPAWTPEGRAVAFLAEREGDEGKALWVIPADGGEARRLLGKKPAITAFAFHPAGSAVALAVRRERSEEEKELEKQGFDAVVVEERQRPVELWIAELPEGPLGRAGEPRRLELAGAVSEISWNPRGDRLALALAPTPSIDDDYMERRIKVVDPAGAGTVVGEIANPGKLGAVAWSPDGSRLALITAADRNDPMAGRLAVVPASGGAPRDLLPGFAGHVTDVAWESDSSLLFLAAEGVGTTFNRIGADGSGRRVLSQGGGKVWDSFDLAPGTAGAARVALVADAPEHPDELFAMRLGEREIESIRRLTRSNPRLEEVRLAPQRPVAFTARDGMALEGVLIEPLDRPADGSTGARVPLILTVHGGPESHYSNGWLTGYSLPGQVAAARGFAVFYPNYRGSTGRGVEFSKVSQADPAGAEFDDLVDAVDHLVASGLVDGERVGVTGGSYGGYATAWLSTRHTDRFAAGVMFVGISELISKIGTSDIPQELYSVHARRWPWENWPLMLERSPVHYVEQARTPLLILGGDADPRVHPSQSLTLFRYLKVLGKTPVRLVQYPGEEHGNRRAAARLDYHLRMMRWFEHYLQGPGGEPPPPDLDYRRPPAAGLP